LVIAKESFLAAKFRGVRLAPATSKAQRMLLVEHLVVQNIGHHVLGNVAAIQLSVDDNLAQRGIEAAELRTPDARAPSQARPRQGISKVAPVQSLEKNAQIVMGAGRAVGGAARAFAAEAQKAPARGARVGIAAVGLQQIRRRTPPVETREKDCCGGLDHALRGAAENI